MNEWFKKHKADIISLICGLICAAFVYFLMSSIIFPKEIDLIQEISYSEYWQLVEDGKVDTVYYSPNNEYMTITILNDDTKDMTRSERDAYKYDISDKRKVL